MRLRLLLLAAALPLLSARNPPPAAPVDVVLHTAAGDIEIAVDLAHAPNTAANFLWYVDQGLYDGGSFHRTVTAENDPQSVKIQVVQAGINPARRRDGRPAIPLERTSVTGLHHRDGTVSMARSGPDSATSDFFICIGDQPALDFGGQRNPDGQGFAAFGQVISGMDTVRRIQLSPAAAQNLTPPVMIVKAGRTP